jgi:hypothetical protein
MPVTEQQKSRSLRGYGIPPLSSEIAENSGKSNSFYTP